MILFYFRMVANFIAFIDPVTLNSRRGLKDAVETLRSSLAKGDSQGDWLNSRVKEINDWLAGFEEATTAEPVDEMKLLPDLNIGQLRELAAEAQVCFCLLFFFYAFLYSFFWYLLLSSSFLLLLSSFLSIFCYFFLSFLLSFFLSSFFFFLSFLYYFLSFLNFFPSFFLFFLLFLLFLCLFICL